MGLVSVERLTSGTEDAASQQHNLSETPTSATKERDMSVCLRPKTCALRLGA